MDNFIGAAIFASVLGIVIALTPPAFAQSVAGTTDHSVANVTPPSGNPDGAPTGDAAMQAFQALSPEERNAMLQQAIETFKSMTPEQQQALTAQAKAMGGDTGAFGAQWDKLLTPDQKKMLSEQLQPYVKTAEQQATQQAAPSPGDPVASITQQVQNLTPEQKQALIRALGGTPAAPAPSTAASAAASQPDSCTPYQNANPSFYALCESRIHPVQK